MSSLLGPITPEQVSASIQLSDIHLSPDGSEVIYVCRNICEDGQDSTAPSSIWIAETENPGSERQLTAAKEQPSSPSFHPEGETIIYLADSLQSRGLSKLYSLDITSKSKPALICGRSNSQPATLFSVSPNGEHVAFTSADEIPGDANAKYIKGNNNDGRPERLRLYTFATGEVRTLSPANDSHVNGFVWSPDSEELLFYTLPGNQPQFRESSMPSDEKTIAVYVTGINVSSSPRCIGRCNQSPGAWERQSFIWPTSNEVVDISKYDPLYRSMDGMATNWHSLDAFDLLTRAGGETDSPNSLIDLHFDGLVAILIERGMSTVIEIWKGGKYVITLLKVNEGALSTAAGSWDIKRLPDGTFAIAIIKSSAIHQQPEEIWITSHDSSGKTTSEKLLTSHNKQLGGLDIETSFLEWNNNGTALQGTITYPPNYTKSSAPLPTILFIHSGPYDRTTPSFKLDKFRLQLFLASHGYLVLSPNYRGSSGRGSAFARASGPQLVTESWSDCDNMIDHAISLKLADPARLAIAGHSSGGYLAALGASITKDRYKACITWSGASDLTSLVGTSQTPEFQFSISGLAPWYAEPDNLLQEVGGRTVHPSPVRNLEGVDTAFLILHGEEDPQVPVSQAMVLWRGLKRLSKFSGRHQMVVYRREGHVFAEKGHLEAALESMLEHLSKYSV